MYLVTMSAAGAVLIGVILLLRPLVVARLPKRTLLVLWAVALCRLLLPVSIASPLSIYNGVEPLHRSIQAEAPSQPVPQPQEPAVLPPVAEAPAAPEPAAPPARPALTGEQRLTAVLLTGSGLLVFCFAAAYGRCLRKFSGAVPLEQPLLAQWQQAHPRPRVRFRQGGGVSSPLTYGLLRPVILFPEDTDWADAGTLKYVLAHEYTHIRRRDAGWKLALAAALCLHWFNPLVWAMYFFANRDLELACDEAVVRTFGADSRPDYALSILRAEEARRALLPLCSGFRRKSALEERITAIMKTKRYSAAALAAAGLLVIGVTAAFATSRIRPPANRWEKAEVWVDYAAPGKDGPWDKTDQLFLSEFPETSFHWSAGAVTAREGEQETTLIWGMPVWNAYLQDLNGDGLPEFCSTVSFGSGMIDNHIVVYDYAAKTPYALWDRGVYDYVLSLEEGALQVIQSEYAGAVLSTKPLTMGMLTEGARWEDFASPKPEEELPVNRRGETYGDGFSASPVLIASVATNGAEGYVRSADLAYDGYTGPLATEEDFAAYQVWQAAQPSFFCVPVYDLDRDHLLGWFDVGVYDDSPLSQEHQTIILDTAAALLRRGSDLSEAEIAQAREDLAAERGWPKPGPEAAPAAPQTPAETPAPQVPADTSDAPESLSAASELPAQAGRWDDLVIAPYPEESEIPVADREEMWALMDYLEEERGILGGDLGGVTYPSTGQMYVLVHYGKSKEIEQFHQELPDGVYPVNRQGQSYGKMTYAEFVGYEPDLVEAGNGYMIRNDFVYQGCPYTTEDGHVDWEVYSAWMETQPESLQLPIYDLEQTRVVGYQIFENGMSGDYSRSPEELQEEMETVAWTLKHSMGYSDEEVDAAMKKLAPEHGWPWPGAD